MAFTAQDRQAASASAIWQAIPDLELVSSFDECLSRVCSGPPDGGNRKEIAQWVKENVSLFLS